MATSRSDAPLAACLMVVCLLTGAWSGSLALVACSAMLTPWLTGLLAGALRPEWVWALAISVITHMVAIVLGFVGWLGYAPRTLGVVTLAMVGVVAAFARMRPLGWHPEARRLAIVCVGTGVGAVVSIGLDVAWVDGGTAFGALAFLTALAWRYGRWAVTLWEDRSFAHRAD